MLMGAAFGRLPRDFRGWSLLNLRRNVARMRWGLIALVITGIGAGNVSGRQEQLTTSAGVIAYVAKADGKYRIRVRAIEGGPSRDLAAGTSIQGWSSDGSELIFFRGRGRVTDVDVVRANGSRLRRIARVVAKGFRGLSPDRRWIVHVRGECVEKPAPRVRLRSLRGSKVYDFRAGTTGGAVDLRWSPAGQEIAVTNTYAGNEACRGLSPSSQVYTVQLGAKPRRVPTRGWTDSLSYTGDGRKLVLTDRCTANPPFCYDLLVWDRKTLRTVLPSDAGVVSEPVWSPDRDEIFVILSDPLRPPDYEAKHLRLTRIDASTSDADAITAIPMDIAGIEAISRDGSAVAIHGYGTPDRMWIASTKSGELQRIPWPPGPGFVRSTEEIYLR
jgi:Tol biopolymer transport system component